ncbi:S8 family serine peptidase [Janthinobacterium sp. J1-1]|uniref:S8 family serine peptidase n=1 Tax=unclassified Janthinobacterium TaxID=2610881 RepID=UPI00281278CA|nr:S8 family serine peptidase [Janthinobacterium sp. J1-1]
MAYKNNAAFGGNCKMSASMAALVASGEPSSALRARLGPAAGKKSGVSVLSYHVFVRCSTTEATSIASIPLAKGRGEVMTAIVPSASLSDFIADERVTRVSAPKRLWPLMDIASPLIGVPQFADKYKVSGKGVIIGIVDTGMDISHEAFAGRVLKIWDQEIAGPGPGTGFSKLGTILTGEAMAASKDVHGHGTHVAGIAGGAGSIYGGIAPETCYLIVKTNFQTSAVVEGVRWIFSEAEKLGRACVVNLSLGGHFGSHDGEDDTSIGISDECREGRLVVASAGNEGRAPIHARKEVGAGPPTRFELAVKPGTSPAGAPPLILNGWYGGAARCETRLHSPTGKKTSWQGLIGKDPAAKSYYLGNDKVVISTPDALAPNGDRQFLMEIFGDADAIQEGTWVLEVRLKSGKASAVDVWLVLDPEGPGAAEFMAPVRDTLIGAPGAAHEAVTVASYTSRNQWNDLSGASVSVGLALHSVSEFSSPGPLRGGRLKPDVTAPGAMIASCSSSDSSVDPNDLVAGNYRMMAGTSMAAPVVTGLLALFLESHPKATPSVAKEWLKKNSCVPHADSGTHDIKWGYGLVKV